MNSDFPQWNGLLKGVSRSFYLSLRFLPAPVRPTLSLAFLCCKAADTIADTGVLPHDARLKALNAYRRAFGPGPLVPLELPAAQGEGPEPSLLRKVPDLLKALEGLPGADQKEVKDLVWELTRGMIRDLTRFGEGRPLTALENEAELDQYTYYVAGCVGRFWTRVLKLHFRFAAQWDLEKMQRLGEAFGKGLQRVNILRDLPRDLRQGRCYLPQDLLCQHGLAPQDLLEPKNLKRFLPVLAGETAKARSLLATADTYVQAFPWKAFRLKWSVLVPASLGLKTLALLEKSNVLENGAVLKVGRLDVYKTLFFSLARSLRPTASPAIRGTASS